MRYKVGKKVYQVNKGQKTRRFKLMQHFVSVERSTLRLLLQLYWAVRALHMAECKGETFFYEQNYGYQCCVLRDEFIARCRVSIPEGHQIGK